VHFKHVNKKSQKQVKHNERKARRERRRKAKKRNTFYHKENVNYNTILETPDDYLSPKNVFPKYGEEKQQRG
jgi:hypothetical protein